MHRAGPALPVDRYRAVDVRVARIISELELHVSLISYLWDASGVTES
jgi:hypothetical protein